jgi:hypothetical protein
MSLPKKYDTLDKIESVLEYCQTSSSDLTLPIDLDEEEKPAAQARKLLLEIKNEVKEIKNSLDSAWKII